MCSVCPRVRHSSRSLRDAVMLSLKWRQLDSASNPYRNFAGRQGMAVRVATSAPASLVRRADLRNSFRCMFTVQALVNSPRGPVGSVVL